MKRATLICGAALGALALASVGGSNAGTATSGAAVTYVLTASLSPSQRVPPGQEGKVKKASGIFRGTLSIAGGSGTLTWDLRHSGLTGGVTAAEIRLGRPGRTGPVVMSLCAPCRPDSHGVLHKALTWRNALLRTLLRGGAYVNLDTSQNPMGEIRGQLEKWLSYTEVGRSANLVLVGSHGGDNSGFNFNGFSKGALVVSLPQGWTVNVDYSNEAFTVSHSCGVVQPGASPAIKDAAAGLARGKHEKFRFTPARTGTFRVVSLVPGDVAAGMWDVVQVTERGLPSLAIRRASRAGLNGIHVSGNRLLDNSGAVVRLHGVNYSGVEYACVQGWGIFDGPSDQAMVNALKTWHVNIVRIPLNEDCWLNINGIRPAYAGSAYQKAVMRYVRLLHQNGIYAELSLIWGAPGNNRATYQSGGPDADHSPAFWSSLAAAFRDDQNVILAPWGETITGWTCFMQTGCDDQATFAGEYASGYRTAPMSQAVTLMRQAGYRGPIAIPCIAYANLCANYNDSSWLASHPHDPNHQLIAEVHLYGKNVCDTIECLDRDYAPLAKQFPLIFGEVGQTYDASDCGSSYISTFLNWADEHAVGYEAWTWNKWGGCGVLIANFNGTPGNAFGRWVHDHYIATFP